MYLIDPYAEANLFDRFLLSVPEGVSIRLLVDAKAQKATLKPAAEAWISQFQAARPLEVRKSAKGVLHDRLVVLDLKVAWLLGQSFNQLASRSNTYLAKAPDDLADLKIQAYEALWQEAQPV